MVNAPTATPTVTGAVARRDNGAAALIAKYSSDFATVLPSHIKPSTWVRLAQGTLRRDAKLAEAAEANPASFMAALLECARLGHEPGTDHYALVPFKDRKHNTVEIVGIEQYQGVIERIYRAGAVASVKAEVVREADRKDFRFTPDMDRPEHQPDWFADRGELIGVYAYAVMKDGSTSRVVVMGRDEVMKHKAMARGADAAESPWKRWETSMWLKTAVHELEKWVPTSSEYRREQLRAIAESRPEPPAPAREHGDVVDGEIVTDPAADPPAEEPA